MTDREVIKMVPHFYETPWFREGKNCKSKDRPIDMVVDGRKENFKLGENVHSVCLYQPKEDKLYFIRKMTEAEIKAYAKSPYGFEEEVKFQECRDMFLNYFKQLAPDSHAESLLYSVISNESLFISWDDPNSLAILN